MDKNDYLAITQTESEAFIDAVAQNFGQVVAHCNDWPVVDLAVHQGVIWQVATANVLAASGEMTPPAHQLPKDIVPTAADVAEYLTMSRSLMLDALSEADPAALAWTFAANDQTAGFWQRRMAHETAMHRWDAQEAGGAATPFEPSFASDGIDEYTAVGLLWSSSRPHRIYPSSSIHLHCTDVAGEWTLVGKNDVDVVVTREHAKGDAAVRGPANDLLLWVWGRPGGDVEIFGDAEIAETWRDLAP